MIDEHELTLLHARVVELETHANDLSARLDALGVLCDRIVQAFEALHGEDPHLAQIEDAALEALRPRPGRTAAPPGPPAE